MKKPRIEIYVKAFPEKNEVIYTGIEFAEFIKNLLQPIENIMIINGGCTLIRSDTKIERKFELFEGHELVGKLMEENVHSFGDFCFVDYASPDRPCQISEQEIAELLYLGFCFNPCTLHFLRRFKTISHTWPTTTDGSAGSTAGI